MYKAGSLHATPAKELHVAWNCNLHSSAVCQLIEYLNNVCWQLYVTLLSMLWYIEFTKFIILYTTAFLRIIVHCHWERNKASPPCKLSISRLFIPILAIQSWTFSLRMWLCHLCAVLYTRYTLWLICWNLLSKITSGLWKVRYIQIHIV